MPKRLSEISNVTRQQLEDLGVYDTIIDYDSKLHIDPALLRNCGIPEFENATKKIVDYFTNVIRLIRTSNQRPAIKRAAINKLIFGEGLNTGLGYSGNGTDGSGIGPEIADRIFATVKEILDAGNEDPAIFELVPLFEKGIGPDRISDMTSIILSAEFQAYTKRISETLQIKIPLDNKDRPIIFVPKIILADLPVSQQWEDIQIMAAYSQEVRDSFNEYIGMSWKKLAKETTKEQFKDLMLENPEILRELIELYKNRTGRKYDFEIDHFGIMLWDILGLDFTNNNPLDLSNFATIKSDNILGIVETICIQYKNLIENNGLVNHLYDSNEKLRPERFPQLLFYAIADSYCKANNLDLNREINAGSGALDFKVSSGLAKVNLEIKYSSNPKLVEGYEKQLTTYNMAEGVDNKYSVYLILRVNDNNDHKIKTIRDIIIEREKKGIFSALLIVVDAIVKPSASKR